MKKQYSLIKFRGSTWGGSILALILLITSIQPAAAVVGVVQRVSVDSSAAQVNGPSTSPSISDDGLMVAFASTASNLITGDTNGESDIFLRNRDIGVTTRISTGPGGLQADRASDSPSISADGAFVAFRSDATNLVANDTNNKSDIFLRNVYGGRTILVSVASDGTQGNNNSYAPSVASIVQGNFRIVYVAYYSYATDLMGDGGDSFPSADVFVTTITIDSFENVTGIVTEMVSVNTSETQGNGESSFPSISGDGRFVAFQSKATNLAAEDPDDNHDIFVRDRTETETICVSLRAYPSTYLPDAYYPAISANGNYVAFQSSSHALVPSGEDDNSSVDIFVRNRTNNQIARASLNNTIMEVMKLETPRKLPSPRMGAMWLFPPMPI